MNNSKKLFPAEVMDVSIEQIIHRFGNKSHLLYIVVLIFSVAAFFSMFFVYLDVNVTATGLLKPPGDRIVVSSSHTGRVERMYVAENQRVKKGDTLVLIDHSLYREDLTLTTERKVELERIIQDLNYLTSLKREELLDASSVGKRLASDLYFQSYNLFSMQLVDLKNRMENARKTYERDSRLFKSGVVSAAELEPVEAEYVNAKTAIYLLCDRQLNEWKGDRLANQNELRQVSSRLENLQIQQNQLVIYSPSDGNVVRISGITEGTYLHDGQEILSISSDDQIIAECYIYPRDIGLIRPEQDARIQVDAYNYNDWGMLEASVKDVSHDIFVPNEGQPYFKVICQLDKDYLQLRNGYKGYLKKGMTVNARFIVTRRTVFQLLYDKVDNWLNPNVNPL